MKQIAEQDRKFIDMGDLKVYHSIYPVTYPVTENAWGPIIRFDDKIIMPGRQEIQNFTGRPILIVRVLINGSAAYYDSTGYRKVLREKDTLVIGYGEGAVQAIIYNYDEQQENELLEIWFAYDSQQKIRQFKAASVKHENYVYADLPITAINRDSILLYDENWLWRGTFNKDSSYTIEAGSAGARLIVYVLSGAVVAGKQELGFRDGIIMPMNEAISLHFEKQTDLLLIQLNNITEDLK